MRHEYYLALIILASAISAGCGGGNSARQDVGAGQLAVFPSTLNFGSVAIGQKTTRTGTLKAGNASIHVASAEWSGEGYSLSGIAFPVTVAAGQSVSFKVTFAPQKGGKSPGNIRFLSDASNSPHAESFSANAALVEGAHRVTLSWHTGNSDAIAYNTYRRAEAEGAYMKLNSDHHPLASFTDASVQSGQTYFYVATALNKHGKESKFSNQVQVTIPNS